MTQESVFAGIDVAKERLDMAIRPSGTVRTVPYDADGVRDLVSELQSLEPSVVVLESTGGLESPLAGALAAASLPVVVVNPRQVRDFAKATGPRLLGGWPRPTSWTPRYWHISPRRCVLRSAHCRTLALRNSTP